MNPNMTMRSIETVKRCIMNNLGDAAASPRYSAAEELKNGSLIPIKTEFDDITYHSIYVYHKNEWISPQMELALDLLKKCAGTGILN